MKSPFPGMDPYLEQFWGEVHQGLIIYTRDQIRSSLPRDLRVRVEERVFLEAETGDVRTIRPDVYVVEYPRALGIDEPRRTGETAVAEPILVHLDDEPVTQGYLEIVDAASGNRVVIVIEFVSPSNKLPGEGQELYLGKKKEIISAGASMVEIDLTRTGNRSSITPELRLAPSKRAHYLACITRGWKTNVAELYPLRLSEVLSALRIPLRQSDVDAVLNLQALVDQCYENGDYDYIDYRLSPKPPLDPDGAIWAENWLRAKSVLT